MRFVYSDRYKLDIGAHVFQTEKYALVRDNLLAANQAVPADFIEPPEPNLDDIRLVHTKEYVDDMVNLRWSPRTVRSELPLTTEVVQGFMLFASGTVAACRFALEDKVSMHIGGGFHHAFADHGEGFCYVNDIAVGIRKMQQEKRIERAAVIDCDLHQGNGTARIFQGDASVHTFSIHQEHVYPIKERSDLDIGLDDETGDDVYLEQLQGAVPRILTNHKPELVVYVAGADPYRYDQLGGLRLTKRGLAFRDRIVIEGCYKRGIPVVPVTAGGYALDPKDTAEVHTNTARECLRVLGQLRPVEKLAEPSPPPVPPEPEHQPS
ncbi:MAG: histone deacetylase [candidate division WOR-3 bacterium]|nr:histone deacetylase [candidate division WOR-3 bacterium]